MLRTIFAIFANFSLAQSITSGSIPLYLSKKPSHRNNDSPSFVLEITDNYIHLKNIILIGNRKRQMYNYGDHDINY